MNELSAEICNELVVELDKVKFLGEGIGTLLSDYIFLSLHRLPKKKSFSGSFVENLRCLKSVLSNDGENIDLKSIRPGKILFLYQSGRPDMFNFTKPIVERMGHENSIIYGISHDIFQEWPLSATLIDSKKLPKIDKLFWWREFKKCYPIWKKVLDDFESRYHLDPIMPSLRIGFVKSTKQLIRTNIFLKRFRPALLFTDYDRSAQIAPFITSANSLGIPTVTCIQNVTEISPSFGTFPSIAKHICCWGNMMFNDAIDHQVPEEKLRILGNQNSADEDRLNLIEKENLVNISATITLALSPVREQVIEEIIEMFVNAISTMKNINPIIRLHPAQDIRDFKVYESDNITILRHTEVSKVSQIEASSVVVGHETCFLTDAVVLGTPVVVLDVLNRPLKLGKQLALYGNMPIATSSEELKVVLEKILHDQSYQDDLNLGSLNYRDALFYAKGSVAADNIYEFINNLISNEMS